LQSSSSANQPVRPGVSPAFAYLTIGLLVLLIGGGTAVWIMSRDNPPKEEIKAENAAKPDNTKKPDNTEKPEKNEQPKVNSAAQQNPPPEIPTLTDQAVRRLIDAWEKAQDTRNFSLYKSCYDASFKGIKRTASGSVSSYNYSQWLSDRQRMMNKAAFMEVRVENLRISIQTDTGTVEFDQYFSTPGYRDFGPKIMNIRMTEAGAKIVYEELKSATLLSE
jgi:hypothetical protein